ncbi:unnamed protein product [Urochloa decumbens]|uniref:MADS-box domain-containing protein n=1 Tax=Urochloa decumbens TaxID=240449 RepID=A0ABC8Y4U1_9POAL
MPRGKLEMKLIENPKKRRATYKNRRDGLIHKASQLTTLCGVEALLVCYDPEQKDGAASAASATWPADREDVIRLIDRYRETPADKMRHSYTAATYYQEELAKQQRKLLKMEQCGPDALSLQDCRLADLSTADLAALLATLDDTLHKAQRRIAALGIVHVVEDNVPPPATAPTPPHAAMMPMPLAGYRPSLDLAFVGMPDAGAMVPQYYFPPPHDSMLPLPQPPCLAYHQIMPLPSYASFQMPMAQLDLCMTGTGAMDFPTFATAAGFYDDFMPAGFDATGGGGVYVDDYVAAAAGGQGFAAGHAGAGYQQEHHMLSAAAWNVSRLNNDPAGYMDAVAAFQERNDLLAELPAVSSCSSNGTSFQGRFQKK